LQTGQDMRRRQFTGEARTVKASAAAITANAFPLRPIEIIEIQIRSDWNLGVLSFRPTLEVFLAGLSPKGKA
jgi:hypothetical protein